MDRERRDGFAGRGRSTDDESDYLEDWSSAAHPRLEQQGRSRQVDDSSEPGVGSRGGRERPGAPAGSGRSGSALGGGLIRPPLAQSSVDDDSETGMQRAASGSGARCLFFFS